MLKELSRRLQHCNDIAVRINNANDSQLQELKTQLAQQMGKPVGLHTMGIPAAISTLGDCQFCYSAAMVGLRRIRRTQSAGRKGICVGSVACPSVRRHQRSDDVYDG